MRLLGLAAFCLLGAVLMIAIGRPQVAAPLLVGGFGFAIGVALRWLFSRLRGGSGPAGKA
jgi:hypothetical protein